MKLYLLVCVNCCVARLYTHPPEPCFRFRCSHCGYDGYNLYELEGRHLLGVNDSKKRLVAFRKIREQRG